MIFFGSTALCTGAAFLRRGSRRLLPAPHRRYGRGGSGTDGCHEGIMDFLHGSPACCDERHTAVRRVTLSGYGPLFPISLEMSARSCASVARTHSACWTPCA